MSLDMFSGTSRNRAWGFSPATMNRTIPGYKWKIGPKELLGCSVPCILTEGAP